MFPHSVQCGPPSLLLSIHHRWTSSSQGTGTLTSAPEHSPQVTSTSPHHPSLTHTSLHHPSLTHTSLHHPSLTHSSGCIDLTQLCIAEEKVSVLLGSVGTTDAPLHSHSCAGRSMQTHCVCVTMEISKTLAYWLQLLHSQTVRLLGETVLSTLLPSLSLSLSLSLFP